MSVTEMPSKPARGSDRDGRALQKGQQTKAAIVDTALGLASVYRSLELPLPKQVPYAS